MFAERILRAARAQAAGGVVDLSPSIAGLPVASSVTASDSFPFITASGNGYRGTASLIRDYALGISGGTATIPENLIVGGNLTASGDTTLGDATTDTLTVTARLASGLTWATDNSLDIGASGANRPRRGYFGTEVLAPTVTATTLVGNLAYTYLTYSGLTVGQVLRAVTATTAAFGALDLANASAVTGTLPNARTTATDANTASTIVSRDASGNFAAGTITAALIGNVTGNADTATTAGSAASVPWSGVTSTPTTIAGYGITDFVSLGDAQWVQLDGAYADPSWITALAWAKLTGVPSTFTPSAHTHAPADITGFGAAGGYLRSSGSAWVRVSGVAWSDLTGVPGTFTPSAHTHPWSEITATPTTVAGYGITDFNSLGDARWSLLGHTHTFASITSKPTTLSGYGITDAQALDADLTAIAALGFTATAFLKKTAANTWALDTNTYLTGNQTITVSGDATGSGATAIALTLATVNANVGTFNNVTVNAKGLVTAASNVAYLTGNQTITLSGGATGSGTTAITVTLTNASVTGQALTGYTAGSNTALAATDTILAAFGKVQGQINARLTGNQTITLSGEATGSGATSISVALTTSAVTGKALTGYTAGSNTALAATDTILAAFGKVQGQLNARLTANQTITLSGGATGSGTTAITVALNNASVTGQALTGYAVGANTALSATDTILQAFQKLQGQVNARLTGNQTITLSGDVTGSGATAISTTLANNAVTYAKLQDASAGNVVLARAASTAGDYSEVAVGASQLLGRGSSGDISAITLGTGLSMSGTTLNGQLGIADTAKNPFSVSNHSNVTPTNVTPLQLSVEAGKTYYFKWVIRYNTAAKTTGIGIGLNGTATASSVVWAAYIFGHGAVGTDSVYEGFGSSLGSGVVVATASQGGTAAPLVLEGHITVSAGGEIYPIIRSEVNLSAVTVGANSIGYLIEIS